MQMRKCGHPMRQHLRCKNGCWAKKCVCKKYDSILNTQEKEKAL